MIEFQNLEYYSCEEIAEIIHEDKAEHKNFVEKWNSTFKRDKYCLTSASYVYSKLNRAAIDKKIKHITFNKGNNIRTYRAYNLEDICDWLDKWKPLTKGYRSITNIKLVGGEN